MLACRSCIPRRNTTQYIIAAFVAWGAIFTQENLPIGRFSQSHWSTDKQSPRINYPEMRLIF
jgi:hypothetical protein